MCITLINSLSAKSEVYFVHYLRHKLFITKLSEIKLADLKLNHFSLLCLKKNNNKNVFHYVRLTAWIFWRHCNLSLINSIDKLFTNKSRSISSPSIHLDIPLPLLIGLQFVLYHSPSSPLHLLASRSICSNTFLVMRAIPHKQPLNSYFHK